jgi:hypothetical protein
MFGTPPIRPLSFSDVLDMVSEGQPAPRGEGVRSSPEIRADIGWLLHLVSSAAAPHDGLASAMKRDHRADTYTEDYVEPTMVVKADDDDSIAAELALSRVTSLKELKQIRRAFALRNHPDLFEPSVQPLATRRMKAANMLIDRRGRELARGL